MANKINISYDPGLIESISANFDLRLPNKEALEQLVLALSKDYDPETMQVLDIATGVGKTYLMAAFIEYLRLMGVKNVVIVTPGKIIQSKTIQNFKQGNPKYIEGAQVPPEIVTPQDYSAWIKRLNNGEILSYGIGTPLLVFVFNIQQLISPKEIEGETHGNTQDAERRRTRKYDENSGELFKYLKELKDLVVIADESHLYSSSAAAFHAALKELDPTAIIGLTASARPEDHVIYKYPLYRAIQDKYVKSPVIAFRKGGYGEDLASEEQQLRDAMQLQRIKQKYYDNYAIQSGKEHLNAVIFVVCADVDHATQITDLLRTAEFFGQDSAVLQIDSKHDDENTQQLLENLDSSDSSVLAVVSVNKLKEGWDVKNIAVVVALRAMASEILTQQTMGRGLRLPFGKYTGNWQIDQLDIISHQSFEELLKSENVLEQFGLEEAVPAGGENKLKNKIHTMAETETGSHSNHSEGNNSGNVPDERVTGDQETPDLFSVSDGGLYGNNLGSSHWEVSENAPSYGTTSDSDNGNTVKIREIEKDNNDWTDASDPIPVVVKRSPYFEDVTYMFPVTVARMNQPKIELNEIKESDIKNAAEKISLSGEVMYRKEIVTDKTIHVRDTESAEIESAYMTKKAVKDKLVDYATRIKLVPSTDSNYTYIKEYLVPKFTGNVKFERWTEKSFSSACQQLQNLICNYINEVTRKTKAEFEICPLKMDRKRYILPVEERIYDHIESREKFVRGRFYSGWVKSLFEAESFDSYTGEYMLANLLNISPHIKWWHRLHSKDGACIYYTPKDKYYPDFVALDDENTYWIIEGKSQRGRNDVQVQEKREAAENLVRKLIAEDEYKNQYWGYLVAYEDDIENSDTWDDLKAKTNPATNKVKK